MAALLYVCGLGNPGEEYRSTRHNLGFLTVDLLAARHRLRWRGGSASFTAAPWSVGGRTVTLVKPLLFMNASGDGLVAAGANRPEELLVVCDDMALPLGALRFRTKGGSGGHNGLESIIERIGTEDFARLRLGIGAPAGAEEWVDYVLAPFLSEEMERVNALVDRAADAVETAVRRGLAAAMERFNRSGEAEAGA